MLLRSFSEVFVMVLSVPFSLLGSIVPSRQKKMGSVLYDLITHPLELYALLRFLFRRRRTKQREKRMRSVGNPPNWQNQEKRDHHQKSDHHTTTTYDDDNNDVKGEGETRDWNDHGDRDNKEEDEKFCFDMLTRVSRSFALVICELHQDLRIPVCVFYLVLRALDSIEDDVSIPTQEKNHELQNFAKNILQPGWNSRKGYAKGNADESRLLYEFQKVIRVLLKMEKKYRDVVVKSCDKMANGMIHFQSHSVCSVKDYDLYCYYVAGVVGEGLTQLFDQSGTVESHHLETLRQTEVSMGLFLQKTNIIRDFLEDASETPPRYFWPKEVWEKHGVSALSDFLSVLNRKKAMGCLNDLVVDALRHVPDCLKYLSCLSEPHVFRFAAIPQLMAIATLERVYNNSAVFEGVVKIRKGEAAQIIIDTATFSDVVSVFRRYLEVISARICESVDASRGDITSKEMQRQVQLCLAECASWAKHRTSSTRSSSSSSLSSTTTKSATSQNSSSSTSSSCSVNGGKENSRRRLN